MAKDDYDPKIAKEFNEETQGTIGSMLEAYDLKTGSRESKNLIKGEHWVDGLKWGFDSEEIIKTNSGGRGGEFDLDRVPDLDEKDFPLTNPDGSFNSENIKLNNAHHIGRYQDQVAESLGKASELSRPYDAIDRENEYSDHTADYDEMDARLREERGEFEGFYTNKGTLEDLKETNNFRGQSGNNKSLMEEMNAFMRSKGMKLGGPTDEQKAEAIDVEFPLAKPAFDPAGGDWYKAVEGWFNAVDSHIAQAEATGISQGGSKAISWLARGIIGEPLRALRELQETDLSKNPSSSPVSEDDPVALAAGRPKAVEAVTNNAVNVGVLSTVAPAPKGALRVFGGVDAAENLAKAGMPQAQTSIEIAAMLEKKGVSEAKIREVTRSLADEGGFGNVSKAADGQWVVEIPANKMEVADYDKIKTSGAQYLDEVVKFDELFKAFPEAKDVKVIVQKVNPKMKNFRPSGSFTAPDEIRLVVRHAEDIKDVITHEIEHFAQSYRKGAYGANNEIDGDYYYTRSAGELQANSSQIRQEMTAQELSEIHPRMHEQTSDGKIIPRSEQFVRTRAEWEGGKRAAAQASNRDLASDTAPRDWVPVGGDKKHLHKDYVLIDTTTGRPVGSATTKDGADRAAGKRGGREDEASAVTSMKTQDWLNEQWNSPDMKRWRDTQIERHGVESAGGFYSGKKMSAQDISTEERKLATSIKTNTVRKDALERDLASNRFNESEMKRKRVALEKHQNRIDELVARLTEVADIKAARQMIPSRVNEVSEPAVTPLTQGVPKTMSEDIGNMPKRRSKLERLREEEESLITIAEGEPRIARVQQAKKRLEATRRKIKELTNE
jgi:hypothetical protein